MTSPMTKSPRSGLEASPDTVDAFKGAMRLFASGVTVITAGEGENRRGLTASAVCSVTMAPPTLLVCVNRSGQSYEVIRDTGAFCVNFLDGAGEEIALCFAGQTGLTGVEQFTPYSWTTLETGAPALDGVLANVDCELSETLEQGTHAVFFGRVRQVRINEGKPALVHFNRSFTSV